MAWYRSAGFGVVLGIILLQSAHADTGVSALETRSDSDVTEFADEFEDEFDDDAGFALFDPLRGYNRFMFQVNDRLYYWMLKPVAKTYGRIVPEQARVAVVRFFRNLAFPRNVVNNVLQGEFRDAGTECARFGINTTAGVLGLFDVAGSRLGLSPKREDFGQTLGRYRIGDGYPLVLPILGPSNLRDAVGLVPDYFLDPVSYIDGLGIRLAIRAHDRTNYVSLHIGEYERLTASALDPYVFVTDAYKQNRDKKIQE